MSIFRKSLAKKTKNEAIVIVSGLPRCGTSMMMQMLEAGSMPIVTDHIRKTDEDNPRGYYEFEKSKQIGEDASWLADCHGKALKIVSALLYHLPSDKKYKVIFMTRNIEEMLTSQKLMMEREGKDWVNVGDDHMLAKFEKHLRKIENWFKMQNNMEVLYINYNEVIQNPDKNVSLVVRFLERQLNSSKMAGEVQKSLYRQRA